MAETTIPKTTRLQRGIRLYQERGHEITRTTGGTYRVPSCSGEASYHVYLGEITTCSCPDSRKAKDQGEYCKHVWAASTAAAKRRAARRRAVHNRSGRREFLRGRNGTGKPGVLGNSKG